MPGIDSATYITARAIDRRVVIPKIHVCLGHRRQRCWRAVAVIKVIVVVCGARWNTGDKCKTNVGRRRIAADDMARQFLPGYAVVIGHAQVAAIGLHITRNNQGLGIKRGNTRCIVDVALVRYICAGRDGNVEAQQVARIPPEKRCGDSDVRRQQCSEKKDCRYRVRRAYSHDAYDK
ncbi:hypothetical protein MnTg04_01190 [bacterium MnTg04]|nr:hypothetical protein MnTg04_01190 [bacterium MnTg04]